MKENHALVVFVMVHWNVLDLVGLQKSLQRADIGARVYCVLVPLFGNEQAWHELALCCREKAFVASLQEIFFSSSLWLLSAVDRWFVFESGRDRPQPHHTHRAEVLQASQ